ncbi:MAG: hypothetical protein M3497_06785 [Gemmatimonadota bacterium]|nr:hypothetical protein [Gemmatimonadota bacterium]
MGDKPDAGIERLKQEAKQQKHHHDETRRAQAWGGSRKKVWTTSYLSH